MRQFESDVRRPRSMRSLAAMLAVLALLGCSAVGGKMFPGAGGPLSSWVE